MTDIIGCGKVCVCVCVYLVVLSNYVTLFFFNLHQTNFLSNLCKGDKSVSLLISA